LDVVTTLLTVSAPEQHSTRALLLEVATGAFAEEGYAAVSVRDLARRTSLTTGAIYAHFLNKASFSSRRSMLA